MNTVHAACAAAVLLVAPAGLSAQIEPSTNIGFAKGATMLSAGIIAGGDYAGTGIGGQVQWGVGGIGRTTLSIGAFAGLQRKTTGANGLEVSTTAVPFMATGNLHYPLASQPRLDVFGGASLGLVRVSVKTSSSTTGADSESETDTGVGFQVGARYRMAGRASVFGQLGVGDLPLVFTGVSFVF